ncbi:glycosyltransferase family 39 protein [Terriglobus sp.]|uniref:ArnT family glycosyltransferase n=1 Tax=Terriglobus sp. TaxID=1889013 RepID=UPI003B00E47F
MLTCMRIHRSAWRESWHWFAAALLLAVFAGQLVHIARLYSANWDEAHHLYDGYKILTLRDYRANAEVPPLIKITAALPLLHLHPAMPPPEGDSQSQSAFLEGRTFVFSNGGDRLLFPARLMCMLFTLGTAALIYATGRHLFGTTAGLLAFGLFTFDPLVLAHGTLVSTDIGSACFFFAAVFAWYHYTQRPSAAWLLTTGLAAGLAMVTKYTGILVVPVLLLLLVVEGAQTRRLTPFVRRLAACCGALACAWLTIWAFYSFRDAPAPAGMQLSPTLGPYLAAMPGKGLGAMLAFVARLHLLPQAYLWGLANTKYTEYEYVSYFFGHIYRHGPWQYFPAAFLIKSTLPFLLLLLLAPFILRTQTHDLAKKLLYLLLPAAIYFLVITASHFDIGARHMMPIYPFLYVIAGATAAALLRRGPVFASIAAVLCLWQVGTSLHASPNYMAYGNEAWGGPRQVRRYLSDANVDWGQQLKTVKQYLDTNHITNCWFAYFPDGAVQPQDYGVHCKRLPTGSNTWWFHLPMNVPPVIDGTVLISESDLDGVESGDGAMNPYESFHALKPVAILQDGVYVYQGRFAVPLAASWYQVRESRDLARAGRNAQSLQAAQTAVDLAPESPRAQLQLADRLAAQALWLQALEHYRLAQRDLEHQRPDLQGDELGPALAKGLQEAQAHR